MNVKVYGFNHSPWVQAVLLTLHDKKIEHTLYRSPPLEIFKKWGVYMPAVSINDDAWETESSEIMVKIGLKPISPNDLKAIQDTWLGVQHRPNNPMRFFAAFSKAGDTSSSLMFRSANNFILSFIACYMFLLINFVKFKLKPKDPKSFGDQFIFWEEKLKTSKEKFIDGKEPGMRDMLLFGVIQCHSSIPVPPLFSLENDERLAGIRNWIGVMQKRFEDYPHLYSGKFFEPNKPHPKSTDIFQKSIFFLGVFSILLAAPVTIPFMIFLMRRVPRKNQSFPSSN